VASSGRLQLKKENVDLSLLINSIAEKLEPEIKLAQSQLILKLKPSIKGAWDVIRIEQAFTNIISNALKYAPGKPITITTQSDDRSAIIEISDQGPGISPKHQSTIFEPYKRLNHDTKITGLGVGLFITKQIIQAHHGQIYVSSQLKQGTSFTIKLPLNPTTKSSSSTEK